MPGDTAVHVAKVTITGDHLALDYGVLRDNLGLRAKTPILPEREWNPFRLAEDKRRVEAYLMEMGRFEGTVDEPKLEWKDKAVAITWVVHEGPAYSIGSVKILGAPPELEAELRDIVTFKPGDKIDMPNYRPLRFKLAERLQEEGYGHARGWSRTFVDREAKTVAWFFYLDPGPPTKIKSVAVEGNDHEPAASVLERAGLAPGQPFSLASAKRAELALLDTGAFASVNVLSDADVPHLPEWPELGGVLTPEQIAPDGTLVPRPLPSDVAVRVVVVDAPQEQVRGELGVEGDPTRIDAFTGVRAVLRNAFGAQHHLVLEGSVGYGWIVGDDHVAEGVYGSALVQYVHSLDVTDLRVTARWRDVLYPNALLREVVAGPGVHRVLAPGVFVDGDAFFRFGRQLDQPMLAATPAAELELPASNDSKGVELVASLIADRRDDRIEPKEGWLLGATGSYSPGGPLGDHRWLQLTGDARGFVPLNPSWSLGFRGSGGWVGAANAGVPLGARLFGGGAFGFRGFGRDHLSPKVGDILVGGRSLVEGSAELRWLPYRKQFGVATFVDIGEAGAGNNPFEDGVSLAAGAGARVRLWYLPIAIDVAYRIVDSDVAAAAWNRVLAFVRVGEAF